MSLVTLLIALAVVPIGQTGTASLVGTWTAQFEGTTFVRLELNTANGGITGAISLGDIELDQKGECVAKASPPRLKPISGVTQRGSALQFLLKEGDEPDRFEFHLLEGGGAELHFLLNEDDLEELKESGIQAFQPIRLTKQ